MWILVMRAGRLMLAALLPLVASSCIQRLPDADPADIPSLRAQLQTRPDDPALQAIVALTLVIEAGEASGAASLYLGLANEELENWGAAREAYSRYIDAGRFDSPKDRLRGRLALLVRRELQEQARRALVQESQLSGQPPAVRSVAVFPFRLVSDSEELEPLQVALADMMITDLSLSNVLTVLERTQIQSLLNEMSLNEAGYTDEATGARAGRLLRAEHVVQGALTTLGDQAIRFDADVLNTQSGSAVGNMSSENQLEALFDLEKAVVFEVLAILGIELTPAEREAINQNRAENLLAFLAYGRGLQVMDRGDYANAAQFFNQSVQLDPGFEAARIQGAQADQIGDTAAATTSAVAQTASLGSGTVSAPPDAPPASTSAAATLSNVDQGVNPTPTAGTIDVGSTQSSSGQQNQNRDLVQESQESDSVTKSSTAKVVIQVRRPGIN